MGILRYTFHSMGAPYVLLLVLKMGILRHTFHSMGAPYVLLLVLRNSDVEWCIAVEVMKQESFCKVHLRILCIFLM